jgi:3-deoxy-D-manno-octulosonic-acid transferase
MLYQKKTRRDSGRSGDTRFDRVKAVVERAGRNTAVLLKNKSNLYFIAGSTYKICEKLLLNCLKRLYSTGKRHDALKMVLVPHEVNKANTERLKNMISSYGFQPVIYSEAREPVMIPDNAVLVVDKLGLLALLYKEADIVFVGGSFKGSVHSVLEPAIFGRPIITGPYIDNSYEAIKMSSSGGLEVCSNADELFNVISRFCNEPDYRKAVSEKSKQYFKNNTGVSQFIANDIDRMLSG